MSALLIPASAEASRRNNFNAIRLAMALLVVWSHSFALHEGTEKDEPLSLLLNGAYNSGNLAVMAFFVISGVKPVGGAGRLTRGLGEDRAHALAVPHGDAPAVSPAWDGTIAMERSAPVSPTVRHSRDLLDPAG